MIDDVTIRETCACGASTEHSGTYMFVVDLISKWRKAHAGCVPQSADASREDDGAILQVIDERDRTQDDFDKAYALVVGEQPEWSSAFSRADALDRIDEALQVLGKSAAPNTDTQIVDALLAKATLSTTEDGDLGLWRNHTNSEQETALVMLGEAAGEDGEFTPEDTPFLTDDQRAHLNGTIPNAAGVIEDKPTVRAALAFALGIDAENPPCRPALKRAIRETPTNQESTPHG